MSSKKEKSRKGKKSNSHLGIGSSPFPGIRLQNVFDPGQKDKDKDDSEKNSDKNSGRGSSDGGGTKRIKPRKKEKIPSFLSGGDHSPKAKEKEEKEVEKKKKTAGVDEEAKQKYKEIPKEEKNSVGNPIRLNLLHAKTIHAIEHAGISGEEAEADPKKWSVLTNSLRFLWIDKGLHFSRKPTKRPELSSEEASQILNGSPPSKLRVNDEIGEGAYGKVYKCKCVSLSKSLLALKKMPNRTEKETRMNLNEVAILTKFPHPNIVALKACYVTKNEYWMVSELMEGGTLEEAMSEYEEQHVAYAARDILSALDWLHKNGIVHRDLKSPNIMLDVEGVVKLIDFGLAAITQQDQELIQMCGSPYWLSPEMIRMDPHSCPTDIWSFAISMIEMATGKPPKKHNALGLMYKVGTMFPDSTVEIPAKTKKWSPEMLDFVTICLHPDPDKRATAKELLDHAFLKKACTKDQMSAVLTRIFVKDSLKEIGLF